METNDEQETCDSGPSTLGGHVSHTGGCWVIICILVAVLYWVFFR